MSYLRHINLLKAFPGARMSGTYTVESSTELKRGTSKAGRPYVVYELQLGDGSRVEFAQSPNKPPPSIGEEIEGTITEQYGKHSLRRERVNGNQPTTATGGASGGYGSQDPTTHASIVRQVCMKAAAPIMQAKIMKDPEGYSVQQLKSLLNWLYDWAEGKDPPAYT